MEDFYKLIDWLEMSQALDYLQRLRSRLGKAPLTDMQLLQLCEAGQCLAFARIGESVSGVRKTDFGYFQPAHFDQPTPFELIPDVTGAGVQRVLNATALAASGFNQAAELEMIGMVTYRRGFLVINEKAEWRASLAMRNCAPLFKPADIEALAAKMNGEDEQPSDSAAEAEDLRQQWEQERLARMLEHRKEVDDEARDRAYSSAIITVERLTAEIEQERVVRKAAEIEAEEAKSEAEHWRQQHDLELEYRLRTQAEGDALRQELEQEHAEAKPSHLLAVAGLLELLLDGSRPRYNQGSAADAIEEGHPDWRGSSASQLTKLFAEAKAKAKEADKTAQARAEARQTAAKRVEARTTAKT